MAARRRTVMSFLFYFLMPRRAAAAIFFRFRCFALFRCHMPLMMLFATLFSPDYF